MDDDFSTWPLEMQEMFNAWTSDMFNHALKHGMLYNWSVNLDQTHLHKCGDVNNINNYQTILVGSIMAKLFGHLMKSKTSTWTGDMFDHAL